MSEAAPNPYVGPVPFERKDKHLFYGRDGDLRRLAILFIAQRIVLLYSPSGAGKTSLVQARLIPALEDEGFEVLPVIRAGRQLSEIDSDEFGPANILLANTIAHLETGRESATSYTTFGDYWSARRAGLGDKSAVLFFDQFEEVLTVDPHDRQQKEIFFDQLGEALEMDDRLWALFAIREDYLAELDPYRHLLPGKFNNPCRYRLELLNADQALDAIRCPARDVDVTFADEAAEELVDQLRRVRVRRLDGQVIDEMGEAVEPVQLQVVCQNLWTDLAPEVGDTIGPEAITAAVHVDQSLGDFYDNTIAAVSASYGVEQRDIRDWFERELITKQDLRGQVMSSDQMRLSGPVIAALVDAHLVRSDKRRGIQWYELAHDRLINPVRESNEAWYRDNLSQFQVRAEAWNKTGDRSLLMQFGDLRRARSWAEERQLRPYEQSFLQQSGVRERRRVILGIGIGVLLMLVFGLAVGMFFLWQNAEEAQRKAETQANQVLLFLSTSLLPNIKNPSRDEVTRSLLMDAQALTTTLDSDLPVSADFMDDQARHLLDYILSHHTFERLTSHQAVVRSVAFSPDGRNLASGSGDRTIRLWDLTDPAAEPVKLNGHEDWVRSVAFSPDGRQLASGSGDRTIRLWDLTHPAAEPVELIGHKDRVMSVAFSPDGRQLASGSGDRTIRLWDLTNPDAEPDELNGHEASVRSVAFSPDGRQLASGSGDRTIRLWDLTDPAAEPDELNGHEASVRSVAFSPDGRQLASGSRDTTIRLWDLTNPDAEPAVLNGHEDWVMSVAFSPDGRHLASGSADRTIRIWDLANLDAEPVVLAGHEASVLSVAFSPDGRKLASGSGDRTIRLWDLTDRGSNSLSEPIMLTGHEDWVRSVAFSPDGDQLASGSGDRTVRLWDLANPDAGPIVLTGDGALAYSVAFSPDGRQLASGSGDRTIRLWDLINLSTRPVVLTGHRALILSVAFSPDGRQLASGSGDETIRLWDLTNLSAEPIVLVGHEDWVGSVAFSPDGDQLASGSFDETIRLWDLANPAAEPVVLTGHEDWVTSVAFSPDGRHLASGSADAAIRLWDLTNPSAEPIVLVGHKARVHSVTFSPDGDQLASGSADETIRLWDLTDRGSNSHSEPIVLTGNVDPVRSVAFSPDGRQLASGSIDGTIRVWRTLKGLAQLFCSQAGRNFTWDEWRELLPDQDYEKTCPQYPVHCTVPPEAWPAEFADERDLCPADPE